MTNKLHVVFSVDWEPDHGRWRAAGSDLDYGGILVGTPALEKLLDDLDIPCTWFIEASRERQRDLPLIHSPIVKRIAARKRDERGLHIHWRRSAEGDRPVYETRDTAWVKDQVGHGLQSLCACGIKAESFRGGSFLYVDKLARVLTDASIRCDSTVLWNRCHRLNPERTGKRAEPTLGRVTSRMHRLVGRLPRPYFTDGEDVEAGGDSDLLELPVFYNPLDLTSPWQRILHRTVLGRAALGSRHQVVSLFLHIDEITRVDSGPDERCRLDEQAMTLLRGALESLRNRPATEFVTPSQVRAMVRGGTR